MSEFKTPAPELKAPGMLKEFVVGAAGGATQVLIGQPFDIVKVRMQVQANKSAIQVAQNILRHEGLLAFYKGTLPPLLGVGACISIVYSTFHTISESIKSSTSTATANSTLSPPKTFLAGGLAGLANSFVSGPTEHIRIRLQTQNESHPNGNSLRPGVLSTIRYIHAQSGLMGLYRGQTPTMLREFGSYGVWFSVYESLLSHLASPPPDPFTKQPSTTKEERKDIPTYKIASCGIITGLVLWSVNYPFDVVKSKMQADGFGSQRVYSNMRDVVRQTWNLHGLNGFYRGLGPTLARAVPVSAGTFVVVEMVRKVL
ncbi:mitochondrial carrier domain-containing protein [Aspergillus venezuelensis]